LARYARTGQESRIFSRIKIVQWTRKLVKACKQLKHAWEDYLRNPDAIGWALEEIIQDADEALEPFEKLQQ